MPLLSIKRYKYCLKFTISYPYDPLCTQDPFISRKVRDRGQCYLIHYFNTCSWYLDFSRKYREYDLLQTYCLYIIIYPSESNHSRFFTPRICLLVTGFAPTTFVLHFLRNRNWCTDFMPTRATGRAFFSDPKQRVSSFSLPQGSSPCCFATLLKIVFPPVRLPSFFFLDRKVVILCWCTVLLLPTVPDPFDSVPPTKLSSCTFVVMS